MRPQALHLAARITLLAVAPAAAAHMGAVAHAQSAVAPDHAALARLERAGGPSLRITRSPQTGRATFMADKSGRGVTVAEGSTPETRASAFLRDHGPAFGLRSVRQLRATKTARRDRLGMDHLRFQQTVNGVPVVGADVQVHLRGQRVVAAQARLVPEADGLDTTPTVGAEAARESARQLATMRLGLNDPELSAPRREILNRGVFDGRSHASRLTWFVEVRGGGKREFVWVDAHTGAVVLHFSQTPAARNRLIFAASDGEGLPGMVLGGENNPPYDDADAMAAYNFLGDTYDFYYEVLGRDSYDGAGATLLASVHYCPGGCPYPYPNAFWNGYQMVFGDGFSRADDVVAHELTHGVTERSAGLYYYMQSGALNEAFSDIFGEAVDLWNTERGDEERRGDDTPLMRWAIGEDLADVGPIRNMMEPALHDQPAKVSDPRFRCWDSVYSDQGGVHLNSGVLNHAFALTVDGGSYNGANVVGIGLEKTVRVYYRALTEYLATASDFLDAYDALQQSCTDLVGTSGIVADDCRQVHGALDAVELAAPWPCAPTQGIMPDLCPAGRRAADLYFDDMETTDRWTASQSVGSQPWAWMVDGFRTSGRQSHWSAYAGRESDRQLTMDDSVSLPGGDVRMQFNHSFGFESNLDGGVIEYSTDGGVSWSDAGWLIEYGADYDYSIYRDPVLPQPLAGRWAFVGDSWGFVASQLNLSRFAGQTFRFRFRMGEDHVGADEGWWVDDVRIYECLAGDAPALSLDDAAVSEGGGAALFTVRLSQPTEWPVTVEYRTVDGSATGGQDYVPTSGTLSLSPGTTVATIRVPVLADQMAEGDETFTLALLNPVNAALARPFAQATVRDAATAPPPPPTASWAVARQGLSDITAVGYGASTYVAVGYLGHVWTSTDSVRWTERRTSTSHTLNGLTYGDRFVVVGGRCIGPVEGACDADPVVLTSLDAANWTEHLVPAAAGRDLRAVTYATSVAGGPRYVAVGDGGAVVTSPDGKTWTEQSSGVWGTLYGVSYGAGRFVAVGDAGVVTSPDGVTWTPWMAPPDIMQGSGLRSVTFTGSQFVAGGPTNQVVTSPDGLSWTVRRLPMWTSMVFPFTPGIAAGGGMIVTVHSWLGPYLVTSPDGVTWTLRALDTGPGAAPTGFTSVTYGHAGFVVVGYSGQLYTSPTGETWTRRHDDASWGVSAVASDGQGFCAVGAYGAAARSEDGIHWTNQAPLPPRDGYYDTWSAITYGRGLYVAVGGRYGITYSQRTIMTSPDCVSWTSHVPYPWSQPGTDANRFLVDVAYGPQRFVAVGYKEMDNDALPMILTSEDGLAWTQRDAGFPPLTELTAVAYGAGRYVAVGQGSEDKQPFLAISDDGITWSEVTAPFGAGETIRSIAYGNGRFVARGTGLWRSQDGETWSAALDEGGYTVGYGGGRFVAPALDLRAAPGTYESADGGTWVRRPLPTKRLITDVAYSPALDRLVAIADGAIFYSNDRPPALVAADATATEGIDGAAVVGVTLSPAVAETVTVQYSTLAGTARAGSDFTASTGVLTFEPGSAQQSILVPLMDDAVYEGRETFSLRLSTPVGATLADAEAVVMIGDDDPAPTLAVDSATVREGHSGKVGAAFTVSLSGQTSVPATVAYATVAGSADPVRDYVHAAGTLTFPAGVSQRIVSVSILGDTRDETDETFTLVLSAPSHAQLTVASATGTILDDDEAGELRLSAAAYQVSEAGRSAVITVTRANGSASGVSVPYATRAGAATAGVDFTTASGALTFAAGVSSRTILVPILNDGLCEGAESFRIELGAPQGAARVGTPSMATVTIIDDEKGGTVQFSSPTYAVKESTPTAIVTVRRVGGAAAGVTVDYATADDSATAGSDYTAQAGTLSFGANVMTRTLTIPIRADSAAEGDETIRLVLSRPTGGALLGTPHTAVVGIVDDEPVARLGAAAYTVAENGGTAKVVVQRTGGTAAFSVSYATRAGSAQPGSDYVATSGTLSFAAGVLAQTIRVAIRDDASAEGNETFSFSLENAVGAAIGTPNRAELTIQENEPGVQFALSGYEAQEGQPLASIVVKRLGGPAAFSVDYAAGSGTAASGDDFGSVAGTLDFPAGITTRTFTVPIVDDGGVEGEETVTLTLARPVGAFLGTQSSAVLRIADNEPGVELGAATYRVTEAGLRATVIARRVGGPGAFSVGYAALGGSATAGDDFAPTAGRLTFGADVLLQTFTVPVRNDALDEPDETIGVTLSAPEGAFVGTRSTATITIVDDDVSTLGFSAAAIPASEGIGELVVAVTRSGLATEPTRVDFAVAAGTATDGEDFLPVSGTLTLAPGEGLATFAVPVLQDAVAEASETLTLSLSNPQGQSVLGSTSSAVVVIVDDDGTVGE